MMMMMSSLERLRTQKMLQVSLLASRDSKRETPPPHEAFVLSWRRSEPLWSGKIMVYWGISQQTMELITGRYISNIIYICIYIITSHTYIYTHMHIYIYIYLYTHFTHIAYMILDIHLAHQTWVRLPGCFHLRSKRDVPFAWSLAELIWAWRKRWENHRKTKGNHRKIIGTS